MFFLIQKLPRPWGAWGEMLWSGLSWDSRSGFGIERVGPFSPGLYLCGGSLIVTDEARRQWRAQGFTGLEFLTIPKRKTILLDWRCWPESKDIAELLNNPAIKRPMDLIRKLPDNRELMWKMPDYWLANPEARLPVSRVEGGVEQDPCQSIFIREPPLRDLDFYRGDEFPGYFLSQRAMELISNSFPGHFSFHPVLFGEAS